MHEILRKKFSKNQVSDQKNQVNMVFLKLIFPWKIIKHYTAEKKKTMLFFVFFDSKNFKKKTSK